MKKVLVLLLLSSAAFAGFSNNGRMQSRILNLRIGGALENNGELIGLESSSIACSTFAGDGLLRSPKIELKTCIFAYTGVIECTDECIIITKQPFDDSMFQRKGRGNFIIMIDPQLDPMDCDFFSWQGQADALQFEQG